MGINACKQIHEMQKNALKQRYLTIKEETEEKSHQIESDE